jgi:cytochrome c peroxidase
VAIDMPQPKMFAIAALFGALSGCAPSGSDLGDVSDAGPWTISTISTTNTTSSPLSPLPKRVDGLDPRRVALGRELFGDTRLSGDGLVSCANCHSLALGGGNGERKSSLPDRAPVGVNVPTILNVAYLFRYAWNGRYETIEDQIDFALTAASAMRSTWPLVVRTLSTDARMLELFRDAYPEGLSALSARDALATYARSLSTPDARFDRFLRGELALSTAEQSGYARFQDYGCVSCHQGVNVGGNMFERLGVMRDYFETRRTDELADLGRYPVTKLERDRHVFRVPSLRNVALTAPYFHDGSAATLADAITTMGRYQLGRELSAQDVADIDAFLRTLTGELDGRPL